MRKVEESVIIEIIHKLESQEHNIDIAKNCNVSLSLVEKINQCKIYTNLHQYKNNIRNENKEIKYRETVFNEYIFKQDCVLLHIVNTSNEEAFGKIDLDDYERVKKYKWTLSIHEPDIRIISN